MLREYEKQSVVDTDPTQHGLDRVPVFAVSASLMEKDRQTYIESGFDGWIMKPIDFQRANTLLDGTRSDDVRNGCVYQPGMWEQGGWFKRCDEKGEGRTVEG